MSADPWTRLDRESPEHAALRLERERDDAEAERIEARCDERQQQPEPLSTRERIGAACEWAVALLFVAVLLAMACGVFGDDDYPGALPRFVPAEQPQPRPLS